MSDEEIIKYMIENDGKMHSTLRISTILNILVKMMIKKGWFTEDEFNKAVENGLANMAQSTLNILSKEEREILETNIKLSKDDLFGRFFQ